MARKKQRFTHAELAEILSYDPATGILLWKRHGLKSRIGTVAGSPTKDGYLMVKIWGYSYFAHRLAWFLEKGVWPIGQLDHRDTVKKHNWLSNLRDATPLVNSQNQQRAQKGNSTGFLGVTVTKSGKYKVRIMAAGKPLYGGIFDTPEAASAVYQSLKAKLHPDAILAEASA